MDDYERALVWRQEAACKGTPPRWWWPERGDPVEPRALALCRDCPVHPDCLTHALVHEREGLWAGTSARRRKVLRRAGGIRFIPLEPAFLNPDPAPTDLPDEDDRLEETA